MSTTTEIQASASATKKAPATKAPAKAAPAKKAPVKAATEKAEKEAKLYVYEATGRAGITNRRTFPHQVAVAADVRDESHTSALEAG